MWHADVAAHVAQVVKADLGGWLGNPTRHARTLMWPLLFATAGSFLSRAIRSAAVLREQVRRYSLPVHCMHVYPFLKILTL